MSVAAGIAPSAMCLVAAAGFIVLSGATAQAECATASTGAGCVVAGGDAPREVGKRVTAKPGAQVRFAPGDVLPRGRYQRLINSEYYGLPPAEDDWRYYGVDGRVLRVRPDTLEVLEDATGETNAAF